MNKMSLITLFRLTLIILVLSPASSLSETQRILVFGDSLSAGFGLGVKESWPVLLENHLHNQGFNAISVINASISGETTTGGAARFPAVFEKHQPDIVILELGGNDGLQGHSPKLIYQNLKQMISISLDNNAAVLLAGMQIPPNYGSRYTQAFYDVYIRLNNEQNIAFIPFLLEGVALDESLMQDDGIHPKAEAQPIIVETVYKSLKPLLQPVQ